MTFNRNDWLSLEMLYLAGIKVNPMKFFCIITVKRVRHQKRMNIKLEEKSKKIRLKNGKKLKIDQHFVVRSMIASLHTECKVIPFLIADVQVKSLSASSSE